MVIDLSIKDKKLQTITDEFRKSCAQNIELQK